MPRKAKALAVYSRRRNFAITPEPDALVRTGRGPRNGLLYVIQKHAASHLHYDFRLEWNGVLLSWAIPKGPSPRPTDKRLAIRTEDHPLAYGGFEGTIPEGQYGAGTVELWDTGTWAPEDPDVDASLRNGELKFELFGHRLRGSWVLVRTAAVGKAADRQAWLLIKREDRYRQRSATGQPRKAV